MWPDIQKTVDWVTFTEEILNRKLRSLCSAVLLFENIHLKKTNIATLRLPVFVIILVWISALLVNFRTNFKVIIVDKNKNSAENLCD